MDHCGQHAPASGSAELARGMETCWIIVGSMPQQVDQLSLPEVWKHAVSEVTMLAR